jgi:hypothetical protein
MIGSTAATIGSATVVDGRATSATTGMGSGFVGAGWASFGACSTGGGAAILAAPDDREELDDSDGSADGLGGGDDLLC